MARGGLGCRPVFTFVISTSEHVLRVVQVRAIPTDMEYYGRGPLLVAKFRDATVLWRRAEQIAEVLDEVRERLHSPLGLDTPTIAL